MAVLEAVRGWEELAGLPHINDVGKETEGSEETKEENPAVEEDLEEGVLTADDLQREVPGLLDTDYVSLMLEYEEHIQAPVEGSIRKSMTPSGHYYFSISYCPVFDLTSYMPDSVIPVYEDLKDTLVSWLQKFGIVSADGSAGAFT